MILLARFDVVGVPEPKGSMTAIVRGNRAVLIPASAPKRKDGTRSDVRQRYAAWCRSVTASARAWQLVKRRTIAPDEELGVDIDFYLPRPPSTHKRITRPNTKPDVDKLTRCVFDCLEAGEIIGNDSRIVSMHVEEYFAYSAAHDRPPGARITIRNAKLITHTTTTKDGLTE